MIRVEIYHLCQECRAEFTTAESLYFHLRDEHDLSVEKARMHYLAALAISRMGLEHVGS